METVIKNSLASHLQAFKQLEGSQEKIKEISKLFASSLRNNGKIIFMGNGGSAADAEHLAAELVGRFKKNRKAYAAISLSSNICIITAIGNDYGFDEIFSRQVEALAKTGDVIVAISTSGESQNVIKGVARAKQLGLKTVGFLGKSGGKLKGLVDISLLIPTEDTPRIQEMHILAGHIICEIVEEELSR
ncbi:MAG: D-sedoheptulose 7-phosphate isomerase [Candidatus Omnitrophica bacterium]|jgi:D-sedoheptulose 7-phosphate isomerase|nr:D-sedoheptulose 7-phosphate isomerase [Candidatus Omnitrophota bacterium]